MDKESRNRLQRATQAARRTLEDEYAEQLAGTFDIRLDGAVAAEPGRHLADDSDALRLRRRLVHAVEHHVAQGRTRPEAVAALLRECACTTLNRFVALKMLEARGLVLECVSRGLDSSGFRNEFLGLADGLKVALDAAYRLYLECLFDELGREVRVLFDRRDPASLLWPRHAALDGLLGILNAPDLAAVWTEDETLGWVYQYFNGEDERRQMRAESQAPRNSRELAVRNQFFTPRYVVEFLTDNTLAKTWIEMRGGQSRLTESCRYLVRRPDEVLTPRAKKDPRDLKVLDPACGSGHFLIYAFDVLLVAYDEAWADPESPPSEATGRRLGEDYATLAVLHRDVPRLVLAHNLHGVDIDPRAAQVAALALWMRAQRSWNELGVKRIDRPLVTRTNIVVAEPMPGEPDLLDGLCQTLQPIETKLVRQVFEDMRLAGDAGTLLRIEDTVRKGLEDYFGRGGHAHMRERWAEIERHVYEALRASAERATNGQGYRRRLFADDAARGFAFVDVCRQSYDVVLMNPPFGAGSVKAKAMIAKAWPRTKHDLYAAFVERGIGLLIEGGMLGAITSRTGFFLKSFQKWREEVILGQAPPTVFADLGAGVLDSAMVETAAYCLKRGDRQSPARFFRLLTAGDKARDLTALAERDWPSAFLVDPREFSRIPATPFAYFASTRVLRVFGSCSRLESPNVVARGGAMTLDDGRFLRLSWEPEASQVGRGLRWVTLAKGGRVDPFTHGLHLVIHWRDNADLLRAFYEYRSRDTTWGGFARNEDCYYRPGLTWSLRASGLAFRILPCDCIIGRKGPGVFSTDNDTPALLALCASMNSAAFGALIRLQLARTELAQSYEVGLIQQTPIPELTDSDESFLAARARNAWSFKRLVDTCSETSHALHLPTLLRSRGPTLAARAGGWVTFVAAIDAQLADIQAEIDDRCYALYGITEEDRRSIEHGFGSTATEEADADEDADDEADDNAMSPEADLPPMAASLVSWTVGVAFGRFDVRLATGERPAPPEPEPFDALPACSPGMLTGDDGLPLATPPSGYAVPFPDDGIQVDDPGHERDLLARVAAVFRTIFGATGDDRLAEATEAIDPGAVDLRRWLRRTFFEEHVQRYSKSRRKAPIYWRLGTPSGSYSVWIYIHRFTRDTLHRVLNDHLAPKLRFEEDRLASFTSQVGPNPTPSQRRELAAAETLVDELRALRDAVAVLAPLWDPDLDDGVIINAAPLHCLFAHTRSWQKECEKTWHALVAAEYDWAHLAMRLWPERVVPKCTEDRSLAIAHGLEEALWIEDAKGKWLPRQVLAEELERLVRERTSPAVKDALSKLSQVPEPAQKRVREKAATPRKAKPAPEASPQIGLPLGGDD